MGEETTICMLMSVCFYARTYSIPVSLRFYAHVSLLLFSKHFRCSCLYVSILVPIYFYARTDSMPASLCVCASVHMSHLDSKFKFPDPLAVICSFMRGCTDFYDMLDIYFYSSNFEFQREFYALHICFYYYTHTFL